MAKSSLKHILNFLFAILIITVSVIGFNFVLGKLIERFELRTLDLRLQILSQTQEHDPRIVQLLLDDQSTATAMQQPELGLGRIPWPRRVWGEVVEYLNRGNPSAIVFDINFLGDEGDRPENKASDDYFTKAVKDSKANVFFGVLFTDSVASLSGNVKNLENEMKNRVAKLPKDALANLEKNKLTVDNKLNPNSSILQNVTYTQFIPIMSGLLKEGDGFGTINLKTDFDGVNRQHTPLFVYNNNFYPSLPLAVAYSQLPPDQKILSFQQGKLTLGNRTIDIDSEGRNYTTWYGPPKTYLVFHVSDVILSERAIKQGKKPALDPAVFKDKIIIIGQTASGSDIHHVPIANVFVGTEIVATNIDNFMNQQIFIKRMSDTDNLLLTILFCILIWISVSKSKSIPGTILLSTVFIAAYIFTTIFVLSNLKIWMDMIAPVILLFSTFVVTYIIRFVFTHRQLESAIEEATKDGLTKLYNHRFFQEKIHQDLANASRKDDRVSLCLIDIDFFKKFNDTYGHRAGDAVLIQVAQTLKENVRKSDLVARYGGEEMCVLLDKTDVPDALAVADKLVKAVATRPFYINDGKDIVNVTISIGVATFPTHAKTVAELIEFSDKGLYRAKENGRNQVGAMEDVLADGVMTAGSKQIKEVELSKAKLTKVLDDFIKISKEKEFDYEFYLLSLIRDKEIFSQQFLDGALDDNTGDEENKYEESVEQVLKEN